MDHSFIALLVAMVLVTALWPLGLALADVSIIDILWAPAFAIIASVCAGLADGVDLRAWIVLALVWAWAIRLGSHIYSRWRRLGREDYRYAEIRRKRGPNFPLTSLVSIFWLQGLLLWIVSWPLQAAVGSLRAFSWLDVIGMAMAAGGIALEGVADAQLARFRADPANRGRVLDSGLWAWSRHPNYFGDFILWWGFFLVGLAAGAPWWTILAPVAMSALLIHFSGAGLMEDTIAARRPGYADYVRRTSLFVPWPPKPLPERNRL